MVRPINCLAALTCELDLKSSIGVAQKVMQRGNSTSLPLCTKSVWLRESGGKPAFPTSSCFDMSGEFVIERLSIKSQPLSSKQLIVGKAGLPPLFCPAEISFCAKRQTMEWATPLTLNKSVARAGSAPFFGLMILGLRYAPPQALRRRRHCGLRNPWGHKCPR
jgi:hypothetical protein